MKRMALFIGFACLLPLDGAEPESAAQRGRKALTTRSYNPAVWTLAGYENAWKSWRTPLKEPPRDYDQAFRDHYGLHPAPYENGSLPMGLRAAESLLLKNAVSYDCLMCHAGSIMGKSYIGLGNCSLEIQALFEDMGRESGTLGRTPFPFGNVRGTSEAGSAAVFLLGYREPDLSLRLKPLDLEVRPNLCEDVPAWWLLKKKKTMYHTGTAHARSVRSLMQFMLSPMNSPAVFAREEATFRDIQAYIFSLEAPQYPFSVNGELAAKGHALFTKTCARCHGTYGADWTYPNKIVDLDVIGTDRTRFDGLSAKAGAYYNKTWFAREKGDEGYKTLPAVGYQAPPLDGIWASAPYLHNGSVPTLYDMLHSSSRPKIFTRSFKTGEEDYDKAKVGWKVRILNKGPEASLPAYERRKVYDTTQPGRGNHGHTFGDDLSDDDRWAVIEYLKTL